MTSNSGKWRIVIAGLILSFSINASIARAQIGVPSGGAIDDGVGLTGYYGRTPWFSHSTVREELRLNDLQARELDRRYEAAWKAYNKERSLIDSDLSVQRRGIREAELRTTFQNELAPAVDTVITDPVVRQRYNQLHWQYQGYDAFQDPVIVEQLELTPAQQRKLDELRLAYNKQFAAWRVDYPKHRDEVKKQMIDARRLARERITAILTPTQRDVWIKLVGQPHEFDTEVYFPTTPTTTLKPVVP